MKLQAVTICINYADYLECIAGNRRHFDRWVVVTVPEDAATVAVCARHGMEVVFSRALQADGKDFNAANNKARALNEGLAALDPEGWAVILDSDVLLPRHFRERVAGLPLEKGCLYAVAGRKICEDREAFEMLRECEPWDRFCDRHSQALGYFNLFHLDHPVNRYVERAPGGGGHDDWFFTTSFPEECRQQIPMTVIHTGPQALNWAGRVAESFHADGTEEAAALPEEIAGVGTVAVVGYFPGSRWRELAKRFGRVLLVDHFQVHAPSGSPMIEADRAVLRGLWAKEVAGWENVECLGAHSAGTLVGIAAESLDALYLPGEVTPDWLAAALPAWLPKLRDGALLCGDLYGLPHWPDATYAIALLLGTPVEVAANGFWWGRKRDGLVRPRQVAEAGEREVVLINEGMEQIERLLVTLHRVRESWAGRVRLFDWGEESPALRIAAVRYGVEMIEVGEAPAEKGGTVGETLAAGLWPESIYLPVGALVLGRVEELFSADVARGEFAADAPWRMHGAVGADGNGRLPAEPAGDFEESGATRPVVLLCTGPLESWTDAAWAEWSETLTEMTAQLAAEIRVAADATVVIFVRREEIDEFEQVWLSLKFVPEVPVIVGLIGVAVEDVWLAPTGREPKLVVLSEVESSQAQLAAVLTIVQTRRVILLPPTARPLPGAELFLATDEGEEAVLDRRSAWPGETLKPSVFGVFPAAMLRQISVGKPVERSKRRVDLAKKGWLLDGLPAPLLPLPKVVSETPPR